MGAGRKKMEWSAAEAKAAVALDEANASRVDACNGGPEGMNRDNKETAAEKKKGSRDRTAIVLHTLMVPSAHCEHRERGAKQAQQQKSEQ